MAVKKAVAKKRELIDAVETGTAEQRANARLHEEYKRGFDYGWKAGRKALISDMRELFQMLEK